MDGLGLKAIAAQLNEEGVPFPIVGRRGRGSWAPSVIREMLRNPRYRGLYVHGKVKKVRRAGAVQRVKADPTEVITVEIPEWRIIDDDTWIAVQESFHSRKPTQGRAAHDRPAARYPLTGRAPWSGSSSNFAPSSDGWPGRSP